MSSEALQSCLPLLERQIQAKGMVSIPSALKLWLSRVQPLFIDGKWRPGKTGKTFSTFNPATGEVLSEIALAEREDVTEAVQAARAAYQRGDWSRRSMRERAQVIHRLAELLLQHRPLLAVLESLDTGKPIRESFEGDILRAAHNFTFFAEYAAQEESLCFSNPSDLHFAIREPLGVVALITPWNLPLYLETWKLAPSLMMGNSCVLKPSELTPLTAVYFAELAEAAGVPAGVFNLIQGFGENSAGEFLVSDPGVDAISFTGETGTGRAIMKSASVGPTRVSFELGGKGASVVFADADFNLAVSETARAAFRNQGEICLACPRIFVEHSRYEEFVKTFVAKVQEIVVGDPLDYSTTMGALISPEHWNKVTGYLNRVDAPAKILTGGSRPSHLAHGAYLSPTVITGVGLNHPISREEVFGPVVSIYPFSEESEVCQAVNHTPYGLSASIWTSNMSRAHRIARELHSGLVWINCWFIRDLRVPFGGQKRSGVGREGGKHSLDFFSEWKSICVKMETP